MKKIARLGLFPGQTFDWANLNSHVQAALNPVPKLAFDKISSFQHKSVTVQNGWVIPDATGQYGTDYLSR